MRPISRRTVLAGAAGGAALAAISPRAAFASSPRARAAALSAGSKPGTRPDPSRPAGTPDTSLPYEHIVVVMMENHSFDTYLGMLPKRGQPKADGFTFDGNGVPLNSNPIPGDKKGGRIRSFRMTSTCQGDVSQAWDATHTQINGGRMDGFVGSTGGDANDTPMGYYDEEDLPFYYSLAKTFTVGNRYFCSAPCQTYPNRRFLVAGTSTGDISTDSGSITAASMVPAAGTILDQMTANDVSWINYFTDLPGTAIIASNVEKNPTHYQPAAAFLTAAKAGTLPSVSFVDPEFGVTSDVGGDLNSYLLSNAAAKAALPGFVGADASSSGGDEETPQNVLNGQAFVNQIVNAVMSGPLWAKTLLIWTYDEHGGYYDHVAPPAAPVPDSVAPDLQPGDATGTFGMYGVRVPAVVVSPWTKPNDVTNVVHDHTSIMATIEMKWNLPSLTYRDANATTLHDYLDLSPAGLARPTFLDPPTLVAAQSPAASDLTCSTADYHETPFYPAARETATTGTTAAAAGTTGTSGTSHGATVGSAAGDRVVGTAPTGASGTSTAKGSLAFTGLDAAVPAVGAALVGAAALAGWKARPTPADADV
jgi:phospholipase C